ncbi:MAG: 1-deoxy-D-xylulose-5-phosphate reductoisomerase [Bifidobacteriaceae bacterium]|nr:1-deoxy-D-xylulose-5-phosphate reductoisomerase [Bifidobacteriaceae bacterium]
MGHQARSLALIGATGSIGTQAVDVIERHPDRFRVIGLAAAGTRPELLARQVVALRPRLVGVASDDAAARLGEAIGAVARETGVAVPHPEVVAGPEAASRVAGMGADVVLNGMSGSGGLGPTLEALAAGSTLALANKESLVAGGALVKSKARPGQIVPVDSEHSAIAQCLRGGARGEVARLILTASGGPFRGWTRERMAAVTPEQALAHPTWRMGPVVTVNSATLVNKALELIEAHLLFDVPPDRIVVAVHPQSIVHSAVEFRDGAVIAQASPPDMRLPIALGLAWPDRLDDVAQALTWDEAQTWRFEPLDERAFPAVALARRALAASPLHPAVLNAANEVCVQEFLAGRIGFLDIVDTVAAVVGQFRPAGHDAGGPSGGKASDAVSPARVPTLADVEAAERWAKARARAALDGRALSAPVDAPSGRTD